MEQIIAGIEFGGTFIKIGYGTKKIVNEKQFFEIKDKLVI